MAVHSDFAACRQISKSNSYLHRQQPCVGDYDTIIFLLCEDSHVPTWLVLMHFFPIFICQKNRKDKIFVTSIVLALLKPSIILAQVRHFPGNTVFKFSLY